MWFHLPISAKFAVLESFILNVKILNISYSKPPSPSVRHNDVTDNEEITRELTFQPKNVEVRNGHTDTETIFPIISILAKIILLSVSDSQMHQCVIK